MLACSRYKFMSSNDVSTSVLTYAFVLFWIIFLRFLKFNSIYYLFYLSQGYFKTAFTWSWLESSFSSARRIAFLILNCAIATMTNMFLCLLLLLSIHIGQTLSDSSYLVGLGSYDITGPAADVNMMGYANTEQIASGVHFRLKARTFIVAEPGGNRVAFVNLDACMASQLVTIKVLERLKSRYFFAYGTVMWSDIIFTNDTLLSTVFHLRSENLN